jgi:hypothetical protein
MNRLTLRALALIAGAVAAAAGCAEGTRSPTAAQPASGQYQLLRRTPDSFGPRRSESGTSSVSAVIGPEGGTLQMDGGYRIDFPAGALSAPTTISMAPIGGYYGVELQPHGLTFPLWRQPVLTLSYAGASTSIFNRLVVVYVDDGNSILEVLPTQWNPFANTLTTRLRHFSGYISAGN